MALFSRLRGGDMQSSFFKISESLLARQLGKSIQNVQKQLERLNELGVLIYDKQNVQPQVVFLTPRFDAKRLPLDIQGIEARKKRDMEKVEAVIHYVTHKHRCRTQLILEYFGEVSYEACGVCDICLEKKKANQVKEADESEAQQILSFLKEGPLAVRVLVSKLNPKDERATLALIRDMLDVGQLQHLEDKRIGLSDNLLKKLV